jgi:regulator of cell morphogenesis and NO signaling
MAVSGISLNFTQKNIMKPLLSTRFAGNVKMLELLYKNYALLLLLQHFEIDFTVGDRTVHQICQENGIHEPSFIVIGNLYNGIPPEPEDLGKIRDIKCIIRFLQNSHHFYKQEKYPELRQYLIDLHKSQQSNDIFLLEKFFQDYFQEVMDHLAYEEEVAFPYFHSLVDKSQGKGESGYSAGEYREHHTDIETKLSDLRNLMLKHIKIEGELELRRKFLNNLFSLEMDLNIHSMIEEMVLLPLMEVIEKEGKLG